MDYRRFLTLAGVLTETIGPTLRESVQRRLARHPAKVRALAEEAIEVLHGAGPAGLTPAEWTSALQTRHDYTDQPIKEALVCATGLDDLIKRISPTRFAYLVEDAPVDAVTVQWQQIDDPVALTSRALALMHATAVFTPRQISEQFERELGLPPALAVSFADHMMGQFLHQLRETEGGYTMAVVPPKPAATIPALRDLLRKAV